MKQRIGSLVIVMMYLISSLAILTAGCTVVIKRPPRPVPRVEVKPSPPGPRAVWVKGHWAWRKRAGRWVWVPGHWRR